MPILILWIIWKIAEPHTTKMKRANSQGPTDAFSSGAFLEVLATLPRWVMFLLCFSLAMRIRCLATIFAGSHLPDARGPDSPTDSPTDLLGPRPGQPGRGAGAVQGRGRKRSAAQRSATQCNATPRHATQRQSRTAQPVASNSFGVRLPTSARSGVRPARKP